MTNGEQLGYLIQRQDGPGIYAWCENLCYWFDSGGYFDVDDFLQYFWETESSDLKDAKFRILQVLRMHNDSYNSESFEREYECIWGDEFTIDPKVAMELLEKTAKATGVSVKELLAQPITAADLVNDDNRFKFGYHSAINDVIAEVCDNCNESPCYRQNCKRIAKLKQMRHRV